MELFSISAKYKFGLARPNFGGRLENLVEHKEPCPSKSSTSHTHLGHLAIHKCNYISRQIFISRSNCKTGLRYSVFLPSIQTHPGCVHYLRRTHRFYLCLGFFMEPLRISLLGGIYPLPIVESPLQITNGIRKGNK